MKHLYLLTTLVIASISYGQVAPGDGAFSTFHVKAENPTEYANFLKENSIFINLIYSIINTLKFLV